MLFWNRHKDFFFKGNWICLAHLFLRFTCGRLCLRTLMWGVKSLHKNKKGQRHCQLVRGLFQSFACKQKQYLTSESKGQNSGCAGLILITNNSPIRLCWADSRLVWIMDGWCRRHQTTVFVPKCPAALTRTKSVNAFRSDQFDNFHCGIQFYKKCWLNKKVCMKVCVHFRRLNQNDGSIQKPGNHNEIIHCRSEYLRRTEEEGREQ